MTTTEPAPETPPVISLVIPLLNEEEVLEQTYASIKTHLEQQRQNFNANQRQINNKQQAFMAEWLRPGGLSLYKHYVK